MRVVVTYAHDITQHSSNKCVDLTLNDTFIQRGNVKEREQECIYEEGSEKFVCVCVLEREREKERDYIYVYSHSKYFILSGKNSHMAACKQPYVIPLSFIRWFGNGRKSIEKSSNNGQRA